MIELATFLLEQVQTCNVWPYCKVREKRADDQDFLFKNQTDLDKALSNYLGDFGLILLPTPAYIIHSDAYAYGSVTFSDQ